MSAKRIDLNLLDSELKALINASAKIFPITQEDVDDNSNPNNYEYGRVDNRIYRWDGETWGYIIADDIEIYFNELLGVPAEFKPMEHNHTEEDIENLDKYTKEEVNTMLATKAEGDHGHDYAPSDHDHDESYAEKLIESIVTDVVDRLYAIENGYTEGHTHPNVDILNAITQDLVDNWNSVLDRATVEYVDNKLLDKAEASTLQGHLENLTVHVTQVQKDEWSNKVGITLGTVKPTDGSMWFKKVN